MSLKTDLASEVDKILNYNVQVNNIDRIPTKKDLPYADSALTLTTAVLFTDIRDSSRLANEHRRIITAKILNAFLNCTLRIVKYNNGEVRSFNGDSLLAIFEPTLQCCLNAVTTAMELNWAVKSLLRPAIARKGYLSRLDVGIGVSMGEILCTRVGIRGEDNNDLIWPSTHTNLAAKLGNFAKSPNNIVVCKDTWSNLPYEMKFIGDKSKRFLLPMSIWKPRKFYFAGEEIITYTTDKNIPFN